MPQSSHQVDKSINSLWRTVLNLGVGLIIVLLALQTKAPSESPRGELTPQFTGWLQLGGTLDANIALPPFAPSLAINSTNRPVVAWHELAGSNFNLYVTRFIGTSWQTLGTTVDQTTGSNAVVVPIKVGSNNNPVVSWDEEGNIFVKRWTGTAWTLVSFGALDITLANNASMSTLILNSANDPIVVWSEDTPGYSNNTYVKGF